MKMKNYSYFEIGFGSHYVSSPGWCFSTEDYIECINKHYHNIDDDDDDEKILPNWFYLPYCVECENYLEFTDNNCSQHLLHRILVTCNCIQTNF